MGIEEFSSWLKVSIEKRGLSYRSVAKRSGVSNVSIHRIVEGKQVSVKPETVTKLAKFFHVNEDDLLAMAGIRHPQRSDHVVDDPELNAYIEAILTGGLSDELLSLMKEVLRDFLAAQSRWKTPLPHLDQLASDNGKEGDGEEDKEESRL